MLVCRTLLYNANKCHFGVWLLSDILGRRLEEISEFAADALLCHVCAGNVDQLISCLTRLDEDSPDTLQVSLKKRLFENINPLFFSNAGKIFCCTVELQLLGIWGHGVEGRYKILDCILYSKCHGSVFIV